MPTHAHTHAQYTYTHPCTHISNTHTKHTHIHNTHVHTHSHTHIPFHRLTDPQMPISGPFGCHQVSNTLTWGPLRSWVNPAPTYCALMPDVNPFWDSAKHGASSFLCPGLAQILRRYSNIIWGEIALEIQVIYKYKITMRHLAEGEKPTFFEALG